MSDGGIPEKLDLHRLGSGTTEVEGRLSTSRMRRLAEIGEPGAAVQVKVAVSRDDHGETVVVGDVRGEIGLVCQRCLGPLTRPVESHCELVVVGSASAADNLGGNTETLVAEDGVIDLLVLAEDELILGLPVVARHENADDCRPQTTHFGPSGGDDGSAEPDSDNPFKVLRGLKGGADD